ncbi:4'-phosphopantetheinyl transferase superfamily protein [Streptacidiphilus sp. ASG 303]|uniref:4'-phosphopantetheinyl transferase family protein n=1 Tax=Streptacidiphilus sp. ASG 303 TaxID=2896847 RepID=UPI001E4CE3C3|nr:4'-phosphopantetheinyl transferase superfamily protein [Streptacidiphilus sp. ASG 303]MCD0484769.1 4'-phosphopantetheinyl transferase superfamily protein [Streptacidiphilus sp. ASG 303]
MTTCAVQRPVELRNGAWEQPLPLPLPGEPPRLWLVRTDGFGADASRLAGAVLDGRERERAAAFRQAEDRDLYVGAHVGLRLLLGAYLGTQPADVPLERLPCPLCPEPHGRPAVRGNPLHFSLSHSGGICLLAFAATPVGVDTERVPDPAVADEIGALLHPREAAELQECDAADRPSAFARAWARKEAYLKGLGTGLGRPLSLDYLGTGADGIAQPPGWTVGDVAVPDGHAAAVAVQD